MITKVAIVVGLAVLLVVLVRRGLIQVDLSFPWLVALLVLGGLSVNESFVGWLAASLGILYAPIAVVFVAIFILLGLVTVLLISLTRLRARQLSIVRRLAALELERQEHAGPGSSKDG